MVVCAREPRSRREGSALGWVAALALALCAGGAASGCLTAERPLAAADAEAADTRDAAGEGDAAGCGGDACLVAGACYAAGTPAPGDPCAVCDPVASAVAWSPREEGASCDDGDGCTRATRCAGGQCVGEVEALCVEPWPACVVDVACAADGCVPSLTPGACYIGGACVADGARRTGAPCERCAAEANPFAWAPADGGACDDGDPCTEGDVCAAGRCGGEPLGCDDGLPCTGDRCDGGVCVHVVVPGACAIDDGCWSAGQAAPWAPCRVCTAASADTWTLVDARACDDGDACTVGDACVSGVCEAQALQRDAEPNGGLDAAVGLGTAELRGPLGFPSGAVEGTLNPADESDWFGYGMTFAGGRVRPRVRLSGLDPVAGYELCVLARCGVTQDGEAPVVTCASGAALAVGGFAGCCAAIAGLAEAGLTLEASCAARTGVNAFGLVRVGVRGTGAGGGCPGYTLEWGVASF